LSQSAAKYGHFAAVICSLEIWNSNRRCFSRLAIPTQGGIPLSRLQALDVANADIAAVLYMLAGEPGTATNVVKLLRSLAGSQAKTRRCGAHFVAIDPAEVGLAVGRED
jgi:L-asparaginase II